MGKPGWIINTPTHTHTLVYLLSCDIEVMSYTHGILLPCNFLILVFGQNDLFVQAIPPSDISVWIAYFFMSFRCLVAPPSSTNRSSMSSISATVLAHPIQTGLLYQLCLLSSQLLTLQSCNFSFVYNSPSFPVCISAINLLAWEPFWFLPYEFSQFCWYLSLFVVTTLPPHVVHGVPGQGHSQLFFISLSM